MGIGVSGDWDGGMVRMAWFARGDAHMCRSNHAH